MKACPETKKRIFKSAGQARRSAEQRKMYPCRVYRCPECNGLHITSKRPLSKDVDHIGR